MPGIGPRSAERIALWIIQARGDQPEQIARAINETRRTIHPCKLCGYFTTAEICEICADSSRSTDLLCVVEQSTDILPLEKTGAFRGRYHSLAGRISPLDHVGPDDVVARGCTRVAGRAFRPDETVAAVYDRRIQLVSALIERRYSTLQLFNASTLR